MNDQQISNRQGGWLVMAAVIGTIFLPLPSIVAQTAGSAGWISVIIGYSMSIVSAYFIYKTSCKFKGKPLPEYIEIMLGKFLGKLVNLYLLFIFFYLTAMVTRLIGELYTIAVLPRTPIIIFSGSILILVVFILRQGLEILARVNELLILVVIFSLLGMVALALPDIELDNFLPITGHGVGSILAGSLFVFALASEYILLLGVILPHFRNQQSAFGSIAFGVIVGSIVLLHVVFGTVGIFGVNEVDRFLYPAIQLAKVVEIGDFIKGIEVFLVGAWTASSMLEISLFFYATVVVAAQIFGIDDYRELVLVFAFLLLVVAMMPDNVLAMVRDLQVLTNIFFLPAGLFLPALLFIISRFVGDKNEG